MKVKELIRLLQRFPQELDVLLSTDDGLGLLRFEDVEVSTVATRESAMGYKYLAYAEVEDTEYHEALVIK